MQDKLIQSIIGPSATTALEADINSETAPLVGGTSGMPQDYLSTVLDFDTGTYNLAIAKSYYLAYAVPSTFARRYLLHLQLLASELTTSEHYTKRRGLRTFLLAETFAGAGTLVYEGETHEVRPGDAFLIDCLRPHEYWASAPEGWGYRIIHFDGPGLRGLYEPFLEAGRFAFSFDEGSDLLRHTRELFLARKETALDRELEEHRILTALVCDMARRLPQFASDSTPDLVRELRVYLQEHCTESLSLDNLARRFSVSKYHLCHDFKRVTGLTVHGYITQCRMDVATYLLVGSRQSVEQVSQACGYGDVSSFYCAFRKHTGMAPTAWRKAQREM